AHNYYHKAKVLPEKPEEYARLPTENLLYLTNGSIYRHLADVSSVFYYAYIKIGICLPEKCSKNDTEAIMRNSKLIFFNFLFINQFLNLQKEYLEYSCFIYFKK